ncbi:UNVERIFIED_CONTAM: hypothetical protein BEN50_15040 [Euhalothece sp. KZN 001]
MPIIDDLGIWEDIGSLSFLVDDWQFFPFFPKKEHSTFKVFFLGDIDLLRKWRVSCWIRGAYFSGSQYFFDRNWLRLYPKEEPEIITYPYPVDLIKDDLPQRQIQAKRRLTYRKDPFKQATPALGLQILEKVDSEAIYPGDPYPAVIEDTAQ